VAEGHGPLRRPVVAVVLCVALTFACAPAGDGRRAIPAGAACATCGMKIADARYACEDLRGREYRYFDAIECLLRARPAGERAWLADWDGAALHAADSLWVVHGDLPSPMGGGYAAFLDRAAADEVAAARAGRVARLAAFAGAAGDTTNPEGLP
jgi:nitrous oxide reductase accessory protein NosL